MGVDDLDVDVGEDVEVHAGTDVLGDVAAVLGDATPRVPRGDHGDPLVSHPVPDLVDEVDPSPDCRVPRILGGDQATGTLDPRHHVRRLDLGHHAGQLAGQGILVGLGPLRALDGKMTLGGGQGERDGDCRLVGDDIGQTAPGHADDRHPGSHGFGHWKAEAFAPSRVDVAVGQSVERGHLVVVEVPVDPVDIRRVGMAGPQLVQQLSHRVVGVREGLEHQ